MKRIPQHIAIVMDGNGRWARSRFLPRTAGHRAGAKAVSASIQACIELKINVLTLFAFGKENWNRPQEEVDFLMELFLKTLKKEIHDLKKNNVRLRIIGDRQGLNSELIACIDECEALTQDNSGLQLNLAVNYSGQWDMTYALAQIAKDISLGKVLAEEVNSNLIEQYLSTAGCCAPDLFIRTSGELRISNFLLWQLAYTELYFTDKFWPDFGKTDLLEALEIFNQRQRRYGKTSEQLGMIQSV